MASLAPNHWANIDPDLSFDEPELAELLTYWNENRGQRLMPSRADIDPLDLPAHLGNLCLVDVETDPLRLRYRLIGTTVTETMGRDVTGRNFDEIYDGEILRDSLAAYAWIVEHRAPLRMFGHALYSSKSHYLYEILNLPLSEDGEIVQMVFGEVRFSLARDGD